MVVCGVLAGSFAAALTNSVEYLAVNKQVDPSFNVVQALRQPGAVRMMLFQGIVYRVIYYGAQQGTFFYLFATWRGFLNCEDLDD